MPFTPAKRKNSFLMVGLTGMSGSGKTMSALLLARGLVGEKGRIALIDTENGRASLYEGLTPFDQQELWPPFTPARYGEKIKEAIDGKYDCLIIDSGSHEWEGEGGILDMVTVAEEKGRPGFHNWKKPKMEHKRHFVNPVLQARMHTILCLRGKEKLKVVKIGNRNEIVSEGMQPIQEDRVLYEMTVSLIMDEETEFPKVRKCPEEIRHLFPDDKHITEAAGAGLAEWVSGGMPVDQDLEDLRKDAYAKAAGGMKAFRAWWEKTMTKDQQTLLRPNLDDFKRVAGEADQDMRQIAAAAAQDAPQSPLADDFTPETEPEAPAPSDNGKTPPERWTIQHAEGLLTPCDTMEIWRDLMIETIDTFMTMEGLQNFHNLNGETMKDAMTENGEIGMEVLTAYGLRLQSFESQAELI